MIKRLFAASVILLGTAICAFGQSVEKGSNQVGFTVRLGIFNTHVVDKGNNNAASNGRTGYVQYMFDYNHGISDKLTVGGQLRYDGFILGKDTTKDQSQINVAYGFDLCGTGAFHFVRSAHTDIYIGAALGGSYLHLGNITINNSGTYNAMGLTYNIDLGARFYIGNHFGIALMLGYAGYKFPNGTAKDATYTDHLSLSMSGSTYGLGLCYKM